MEVSKGPIKNHHSVDPGHAFQGRKVEVSTMSMEVYTFSPPARWGLLGFIRAVLLILLLLRLLPPLPVSPGPCLHQLPRPFPPCQLVANLFANFRAQWALLDLNCWLPHCQLFANFRAQWALLDLNCRLPIWVGTAGPQPPGSERSGHRWTSTRTFQAQWAALDLNLGPSELSGHRWTSTAR